ncbi:MAG: zinc ribbon domain-containing protein [Clostridia bacterium]|nr:zinc ribbon domain-containing protein [Clostridia bacterium]
MSDLYGGFGSLFKGLSGFMPQDDPDVKIMTAQSDLSELRKKELELYAEIGKKALASGGQFPELENKLRLVEANIADAEQKLSDAQSEKEAEDSAKLAEEEALTCPSCGNINSEGVKFCQECGTKLGVLKCSKCSAILTPGTRFCGECGTKQGA